MSIIVCPLSKVGEQVALHQPTHAISLLGPGWVFPELGARYVGRHLCLVFDDVHAPEQGAMPSVDHVRTLLGFVAEWRGVGSILIHCRAGIGRSPAAAFIAACLMNPDVAEHEIAMALRRTSPNARPNRTLIALADREMKRSGRMSAAIAETGRDSSSWVDLDENEPFRLTPRSESRDRQDTDQ